MLCETAVFLAGTLPEHREAERLPSESTATIDNMYEDGRQTRRAIEPATLGHADRWMMLDIEEAR